MINYPCGVCGKSVNKNHKALFCNICNLWVHIKCNGVNNKAYETLMNSNQDDSWYCIKCINDNLPFGTSTSPPETLNTALPPIELKNFLSKLNSLHIDEIMDESLGGVNCKYYNHDEFTASIFDTSNFSAFHLNIASLTLHYDELRVLLGQLELDFSIIGITETKFQAETFSPDLVFPGYSARHKPSESEKGGALLYISNHLQFIDREELDLLAYKSKELESRFVEIIRPKDKNIIVGCIYRHPLMSVDEFNSDVLTPLLEKISAENKTLVLLGDFNIDLLLSDSDKEASNYFDIISSFSLLPYIVLPTRVTSTSSTLIDNIFCNSSENNIIAGNIISCISDHFPQFLVLKYFKPTSPTVNNHSIRDWKKLDENAFLETLGNINWDDILQIELQDVTHSFDVLVGTVNGLLDEYAPYKKITKKNNRRTKSNPWITNGLLTSIHKRDLLYKRYIREKDPTTKTFLQKRFKSYRNRISSLCRLSKSNF